MALGFTRIKKGQYIVGENQNLNCLYDRFNPILMLRLACLLPDANFWVFASVNFPAAPLPSDKNTPLDFPGTQTIYAGLVGYS